jgi:hypothetical protein
MYFRPPMPSYGRHIAQIEYTLTYAEQIRENLRVF